MLVIYLDSQYELSILLIKLKIILKVAILPENISTSADANWKIFYQ